MADPRKAETMQLSGNAYAKVAERMKLFRTDWPKGKSETAHFYMEDGTVEFKAWLWKDKAEYMDLIKSGVSDQAVLRSTADADGDAKGAVGTKQKDFEKLQTIAMGRALANLGYLASGEIASFEEMEEYYKDKERDMEQQIQAAVELINATGSNEELNKVIQSIGSVLKFQAVIDAGKAKRAELLEATEKADEAAAAAKPRGGKQVAPETEKPAETAEEGADASN